MPDPAIDLALLVGGLALLSVGADRFVLGAARLSALAAISPVIIGAVVVGFGTSLPELAVSTLAAVEATQDLALANVAGSNMANVLLVLGGAAVIRPLAVQAVTMRREVPLMLAGALLFAVVTIDGRVSLLGAVVLLVGAALALGLLTRAAITDRASAALMSSEVADYVASARPRAVPSVLLTVVGLVAVLGGAQLVVDGAVGLAEAAGVSQMVIGVTVVAVGTSLPELVTAVAAAHRGESDLVIGNVLGSTLFNALPVAGVATLINTAPLSPTIGPNVVMMLAACAVAAIMLHLGRRVTRLEGVGLLGLFAAAMATAVWIG